MAESLHGVCSNCLPKCQKKTQYTNPDKCALCPNGVPELIFKQQVICRKCYLKEHTSPKKTETKAFPSAVLINSTFKQVEKKEALSKSFLSSSGKMIKKIEKLFNKFEQKPQQLLPYLNKIALCSSPIDWDKLVSKCDRQYPLLYVFATAKGIVGCYHSEPYRIGDMSSIQDSESGFFTTERSKIDLKFFQTSKDRVMYSSKTKTVSLGSPASFEASFDSELRIQTSIMEGAEQWRYYCICKL